VVGLRGNAEVVGIGEQFRAIADDLLIGASDHLTKGVVDFQDLVFEIDEDRASRALLEREAEASVAICEGTDDMQLALGGGAACCFLCAERAYHRRSICEGVDESSHCLGSGAVCCFVSAGRVYHRRSIMMPD